MEKEEEKKLDEQKTEDSSKYVNLSASVGIDGFMGIFMHPAGTTSMQANTSMNSDATL